MKWSDVPGWLTDGQAALLARHARDVAADQWVVEIGSHRGRSTALLATHAEKLYAVDPWENDKWGGGGATFDAFRANMKACGVEDHITVFHGTSVAAAEEFDGKIGLLFIDGAHDRPSVIADIDAWAPHMASNGVICVHDAFSSTGVTQAILSKFLGSSDHEYLEASRSLVALRYHPLRPDQRVRSAVRLAARLPWFLRNLAYKAWIRWALGPVYGRMGRATPIMPY